MEKNKRQGILVRRGPVSGRRVALVLIAALTLGAALLFAVLLTACGGSVAAALRGDGGAALVLKMEIPAPIAAKFRRLASAGSKAPGSSAAGASAAGASAAGASAAGASAAGASAAGASAGDQTPLFNAAAIKESLAKRPSIALRSLSLPSPESLVAELGIRSLEELASSADIKKSGLIALTRGSSWMELRVKLARGGAPALAALFPGIDPDLIDALSPPALEEDPLTADEYRVMLNSIFKEKGMPAIEAAAMSVSLTAPDVVLSSGGGSLAGKVLTARIPLIDALVLEKPIEFWIRWKN